MVRAGNVWDDAHAAGQTHSARDGLTYIHQFADETVVSGQGSAAP